VKQGRVFNKPVDPDRADLPRRLERIDLTIHKPFDEGARIQPAQLRLPQQNLDLSACFD